MEVRWIMLIVEHRNDDTQEATDFRHFYDPSESLKLTRNDGF
jgi:hypothetical protein